MFGDRVARTIRKEGVEAPALYWGRSGRQRVFELLAPGAEPLLFVDDQAKDPSLLPGADIVARVHPAHPGRAVVDRVAGNPAFLTARGGSAVAVDVRPAGCGMQRVELEVTLNIPRTQVRCFAYGRFRTPWVPGRESSALILPDGQRALIGAAQMEISLRRGEWLRDSGEGRFLPARMIAARPTGASCSERGLPIVDVDFEVVPPDAPPFRATFIGTWPDGVWEGKEGLYVTHPHYPDSVRSLFNTNESKPTAAELKAWFFDQRTQPFLYE